MAQKFDVISELYDRACLEIITDPVKWQSFLQTAGRNFKLRFDEQFLLFIQRPDATAVLEIERWNETFERWVNKGAKGIAVFESADRSRQRLIHYFDISDTHESSHSRPVPIWNMKPEYETTVIEALKNAFGSVYDITSLESVIKESVSNIIKNNTEKYVSDFMNVGLGSDIKSLPTEEANSLYLNFVKDSVSYMIMARLGLDVDKIYSPASFAVLSKFNSQEVFNAVGVATNKTAKIALEQIAKSILMYEQKNRTFDLSENKNYNADVNKNEGRNNYGNNIHAGGRLSSSGLEATGTTGSNAGKMGSDEEKLPEGRARNHILQSTDERDSDSALGRSGKESDRLGGELSQADGSESRSDRTDESGRYDEVGRSDEQHQTLGAGNREGTSDLRLDAKPLPSVNEQLKLFEQAEVSNTTTSAFSIPQEVIDATVRQGSGFVDGKMRIYEQFQKSFSTKENADFLKKEYGIGGSSHAGGFEGYSKNFDAKGLEIYKGYAEDRPRVMLKWSQVATLIEQQISQGRYLNDKESARYPQWLEKEEARRAEIEEEKRTREILSTAPHAETEQPDNDDIIGKEVVIDDRRFIIENVKKISGDVTMRDITFEDTVGIPINRIENIDFVCSLLAEQSIDKTQPFEDEYRLLSRLKSDCEYFLGTGARAEKHLWAGSVDEQIDKMRELYDLLPEKPEWLSKQDIDNYERQMIESAQSKNNYEYHLGDTVYIGASEYEVLSFDDNRVMLYDPKFPLFNKEFTRKEFDRKVRENPLNDHLIVENEPMLHFDSNEFEKLIPHGMRYKQAEVVNDNEMYWVTQNIFTSVELQQFQKAIREYDGNIEKFYVTSRDISSYNFEDDRANKVLAVVTPDSIQQDDYVKAIQEAGFGEYLNEAVEEKETATDYEDVFFVDKENKTVTWMYYNPDSNAGGQYVINTTTFDEVEEAAQKHKSADDFFDYLGNIANQTLADVGTEWFEEADNAFKQTPDLTGCTSATMKALLENAERSDMVATNIGKVPIEDYREIVAVQNGFDSYDEMYNEGIRIGNGYDKEPEPIVPAWEQKKKSKAHSFDLHPDIPMAERHSFDLAHNPVEEVNKKERFHRNYAAISVLKECQNENRFATPEEQIILSKYVGWGGIPEAFDERAGSWQSEYAMLKNILTPEEYAAARESTLTAFYTPPEVITAIYKAMEKMGFKEGNLLEPSCGIGNFIGMLPKSMENAKVYGVELDTISAGIAQQLYQKSSIAAQGFEEVNVPDSFFDGVIGNVPFGDFKVSDKRYDKYNFLIHDYFFAKSLDKLRPGGVMALVTSKGTMDKENSSVRKYIAQRAELLGAIRLPNNTFKGNAGTEVVSDILFLQKRDRMIDIEPDWIHLDTDENGIKMNSYFVQHPEMILGEMKMVSGRFGPEATCEAFENADLGELLNEAVINIHGEISEYEVADELDEEDNSIPADPTVRNFSYTVLDDKIYFRENSRMSPAIVSATAENRIKGMVAIRDSVRNLIELQTEDYPDSEIKQAQEKLNTLYDSFTKKYGLINSRANTSAFSDDSSYALLSALEVINEDGELERKADIFYKRTIKPHKAVTEVDTADEALAVSMGEKACIDMEYMQKLSGKNEEELFDDLKGVIFLNPLYGYGNVSEQKYLMADEYLSGNVREKLITAKKSAEVYPDDYKINVEALEKVQPKDLTASEIAVRLGATWLPPEIIQQFMFEFLGTPYYARWNIKVHFSQYSGEWNIEGKSYDRSNVKAYSTYGTSRINGYKIIEETLNLKDVRIFDYVEDEDGKRKAVLNKKETAIAQAKQELIKQGFQDWIWADPARREKLTKMYNEKFNSIRPREYDGSHITFNGMNPEIDLREHQKNAVAHILYGGNTLLAHAVGAGKTFEMVAAAMESKRLGLCNKSLFVVPNHLTEQWAAEFLQLYPAANILVATKKDFETKNRKKFCGRIATGDYDAVIIGHSQFEKIPISIERQRAILEQQLEELTDGIADLKRNRGENFSIKQLEKSRKAVKQKLEKLNDQSRKDDVVTFEELGVDRLFIDESHYYKNLYLYTKMRNVGGIAQTEAQKSSDLFMKCRYLDELTGGRGTVFATGTPISNSMVELYTIQRYLQYNTLVKNNLQHFDAWASTFGETVTAVELTPEGTGYRAKTRFAKFYNLPELMAMFKEVADIKTADMLDLPVPQAHYHNIAVKPSEMQKEMVASLAERAEKVRGGAVDSSVDNMLKITNDGRKLALDQRMLNDMLPDFEDSKINACVDNIYRIWTETADKKSAQLVFCDLSTPKNDGTFSVYDDIRKKLIERGIPDSEVKFIHEADTDIKKKELFQKTRKGEVRVLLGSTQKMGAGTNVQDRLIALHDVDCPWRPSDLEQRSGRIIRQGNSNPDVDIFRYVTEQTFDAYLYQLVEGKQKFASQIMTSKSPVRSAEDIDETALSYAEIKMLATGNPYIKEKMDLDIQVQKLKLLKSNFLSEKYALEDKIIKYYPQRITSLENRINGLKADVETAKQHPKPTDDRFIGMEVKGAFYSEKAEAGKAIIEACKQMNSPDPIPLGKYRGFETELLFNTTERSYEVRIKGATSKNITLGDDAHGNITRIDNGIEKFAESLTFAESELENTKAQFETAKTEVEKPFAQDEELKTKLARLDELNILLNMDKTENEIVGGEPDESEVPPEKKVKEYELTR
ncbi:LPD11 domain-containing protein [Ruminococcus sp.]|uniref:LPD11 domain-containing protein n=1 Tax=Ruminococcus sp. TaxID=41978 RepID=UPI003FD736F9